MKIYSCIDLAKGKTVYFITDKPIRQVYEALPAHVAFPSKVTGYLPRLKVNPATAKRLHDAGVLRRGQALSFNGVNVTY